MELRHLRYFIAVAEAGNLSRAAENLCIAQPPLSVQIRQLEEELGGPLFLRYAKGVRLTPAGEALLPEARELMDRAERLSRLTRQVEAPPPGKLSIGLVPSAFSIVVPPLMEELRRQMPQLEVELSEMISSDQAEAIAGGRIDGGIARNPTRQANVVVARRMRDPFCLAVRSGSSRATQVSLRSMVNETFIAFAGHQGRRTYFDQSMQQCRQAGFVPRIGHEASTVHGVLQLVASGLGVALVPASAALLEVSGVTLLPLRGSGHGGSLAFLRRDTQQRLPLMEVFETAVATVFDRLGACVEPPAEAATAV
jgi:DNA-binding transcriptional LysR family regulator